MAMEYADLLIGADSHASPTGRSYVVFGGAGVGSSGSNCAFESQWQQWF